MRTTTSTSCSRVALLLMGQSFRKPPPPPVGKLLACVPGPQSGDWLAGWLAQGAPWHASFLLAAVPPAFSSGQFLGQLAHFKRVSQKLFAVCSLGCLATVLSSPLLGWWVTSFPGSVCKAQAAAGPLGDPSRPSWIEPQPCMLCQTFPASLWDQPSLLSVSLTPVGLFCVSFLCQTLWHDTLKGLQSLLKSLLQRHLTPHGLQAMFEVSDGLRSRASGPPPRSLSPVWMPLACEGAWLPPLPEGPVPCGG